MSDIPEPWYSALIDAGVTDPRNAARPSLSALARLIGVHTTTVSGMVKGTRDTEQPTVDKTAEALGVDPRTVADWVGRARTMREPFKPHPDANLLDRDEREAVNRLIGLLAKRQGGQLDGQQPKAQKTPHSTPADEQTPTQQGVSTTGGGVTSPPTQDELARRRETDRLAKIEADWLEQNPGMGTKAARTDNDEDEGQ